jgi:hypothetical protein
VDQSTPELVTRGEQLVGRSTVTIRRSITRGVMMERMTSTRREPSSSLDGCKRMLILGRTGSGKTTLARDIAAALQVPHVELDSLYFGPNFSTVPEPVLRERVATAIEPDRWVSDGNKRAVRDLVWPRADTIIWLDFPAAVTLWRLGRRSLRRTASLRTEAAKTGTTRHLPRQLVAGAKAVLTALRSHTGQRREFPPLFAASENQHLAVVRLRSPRATQRWCDRVL